MKNLTFLFILVVGIVCCPKVHAVEYDINSKEECSDIPLLVYSEKNTDGLICFIFKYREIAPFSSYMCMKISVSDITGGRVFDGILDIDDSVLEGVHCVIFYLQEPYLDNSFLSITTDWSSERFLFSSWRVKDRGVLKFNFNLKELYEWYSQYDTHYKPDDERLNELMKQKNLGIKKWRNGIMLEK